MKIKLPIICGLLFAAIPANAEMTVSLDTNFAESVLADVCSGNQINEASIRVSEPVIHMLAHFRQFRDFFTMDAYIAARQNAANCEKSERDIFRFNDVIDHKTQLIDEVSLMKNSQQDYSAKMTSMLAPYVPANITYSGRAIVAVGTPSCGGWSVSDDFYVDLPCISGDPVGLQYLFAHESYHGVQQKIMPLADKGDHLARLFSAVMREGSATAIADFSKIEDGGSYTLKSQQSIQRNAARRQQNFDLLDMAIAYLVKYANDDAYDFVNNIGLSGSFDAPFYVVGADIFNTIESVDGRDALRCLLQQPASVIISRYMDLSAENDDLPQFGITTKTVLNKAKAKSDAQCVSK